MFSFLLSLLGCGTPEWVEQTFGKGPIETSPWDIIVRKDSIEIDWRQEYSWDHYKTHYTIYASKDELKRVPAPARTLPGKFEQFFIYEDPPGFIVGINAKPFIRIRYSSYDQPKLTAEQIKTHIMDHFRIEHSSFEALYASPAIQNERKKSELRSLELKKAINEIYGKAWPTPDGQPLSIQLHPNFEFNISIVRGGVMLNAHALRRDLQKTVPNGERARALLTDLGFDGSGGCDEKNAYWYCSSRYLPDEESRAARDAFSVFKETILDTSFPKRVEKIYSKWAG